MRVLVIGGTSFIGPRVVRRLVEDGHEVTVFHRGQTHSDLPRGVRHILGDRRNLGSSRRDFMNFAPDVVLDMILFAEDDAREAVETFKGVAGRYVMPSSMDVYRAYGRLLQLEKGEPDPIPYKEEGPLRESLYPYRSRAEGTDDFAYRYEKILAERIIMSEPELPATILRLPAVYGPDDKKHRLYEHLKRMDDKRPAILLEKSRAAWLWSRGYVENIADAIALAVVDERASGRIYNVGEEDALTERDWVLAIARAAQWEGRVLVLDKSFMPEHLSDDHPYENHLVADTSRIRAELGYSERVGRERALLETVAWERANPPAEIDEREFNYRAEDEAIEALVAQGLSL